MEHEVDARGLDCPHLVILTRQALLADPAHAVRVRVDTDIQAHNCQRAAEKLGWTADVTPSGDGFTLLLHRARPVGSDDRQT